MPFDQHEEKKALVLLNALGTARRQILSLLEGELSAKELVDQILFDDLMGKSEKLKQLLVSFNPEEEIKRCEQNGIQIVSYWDEIYPAILKTISDPPFLFYMKGTLYPEDSAAIAIVGSRNPNLYGLSQAKLFSVRLAEAGFTIVSGLARGIDQAAHLASLQVAYGRTLAVMGCGLDVAYPKDSQALFQKITEHGAVISEYPLGTKPLAENFPKRNRIIAGLARGVLVIQAHLRSGSLITAHEAVEEGREVFALPGSIEDMRSRGSHKLIKEGACLVESPEDILEVMGPIMSLCPIDQVQPRVIHSVLEEEDNSNVPLSAEIKSTSSETTQQDSTGKLMDCLREGPLHYNEIMMQCSLDTTQAASLLLSLELRKKIVKKSDGRFSLK